MRRVLRSTKRCPGSCCGWPSRGRRSGSGCASPLRHVKGSADVSAPTGGGGQVEASGFGGSVGASWHNTAGYYASGSLSLARYDTDLRADGRGLLKDGIDATVRIFGIEARRRFSLADHLSITP